MSAESLIRLEQKIGYTFTNRELLKQALTHPSIAYERDRRAKDNQRLEYLGDAALQLSLSSILYDRIPTADEGRLTKLRASMVSTKALAAVGLKLHLGDHLIIGKGEAANGGRTRSSTLADTLEALLGAIFIDGGMEPLRQTTLSLFLSSIQELETQTGDEINNPKGRLQEIIQGTTSTLPEYQITSEEGPPHNKVFKAEVTWEGITLGHGEGPTKKHAEIEAASNALQHASVRALVPAD